MAEERSKLVRRRGAHRGTITTLLKSIDENLVGFEESQVPVLEGLRSTLAEKFRKVKELDEEILDNMVGDETVTEDVMNAETIEACNIELKVQTIFHKIEGVLSGYRLDEKKSEGSTRSAGGGRNVKLPKITIEKFSGNPEKWQSFLDAFESLIGGNEELSEIDKFNYLKTFLAGDALGSIAGLTLTKENYKSAMELLSDRYGKKDVIISSHMNSLMKLLQSGEMDNTKKLRRAYDRIIAHVRSLQSLGVESEHFGALLVSVISNHLPEEIKVIIHRKYDGSADFFKLDEFLKLLKDEIEVRERSGVVSSGGVDKKGDAGIGNSGGSRTGDRNKSTGSALYAGEVKEDRNSELCVYCKNRHLSINCRIVTDLDVRKEHLRKYSRCFNCLKSGHVSFRCKSPKLCGLCKGKHHQSLCNKSREESSGREGEVKDKYDMHKKTSGDAKTADKHTGMLCSTATSVLLQTARACVSSVDDGSSAFNVRIVLDSGSQKSYISDELRSALNLKKIGSRQVKVSRFMDADNQNVLIRDCNVVQLRVHGVENEDVILTAYSVPNICPPPDSQSISFCKTEFMHLADIQLADEIIDEPFRGDSIDILVGLDSYWSFFSEEFRRGISGPVAWNSKLGWVLSGPVFTNSSIMEDSAHNMLSVIGEDKDESLNDLVQRFWSLEAVGILDEKDDDVMRRFQESVWFNEITRRYQVSLPWRHGVGPLADNYTQCYRRLMNQLSRFRKDPKLFDDYNHVMQEQIDNGVLEVVSSRPPGVGGTYYLPHHSVVREDHATTRLRVVYDGSSKVVGPSINQCLYEGPCLLPELVRILMRFRCRKYGIVADIEKAFLQIEISETDRDYLRTLWVQGFDPHKSLHCQESFRLMVLRFTRCVFGITSSPFHLMATLRHHLDKYRIEFEALIEEVKKTMFVDDFISGADSEREGYELFTTTRNILKDGGFNLRKFASNSKVLENHIAYESHHTDREKNTEVGEISYSETTHNSIELPQSVSERKVLGVVWNKEADKLVFRFDALIAASKSIPMTKRGLLSLIGRIYDPIGLLSPILVSLRWTFQQACKGGMEWDDPLSDEHVTLIQNWLKDLSEVESIEFPRYCLNVDKSEIEDVKLIEFGDASQKAFGAVIYLRVECKNDVQVNIFAAKSRVAPLKAQTLPRLELLGGLVLSKLHNHVISSLESVVEVKSSHFHSDSKTTLCWIRNKERKFKQFVEERTKRIRELTDEFSWKHVKGEENPADLTTRYMMPSELKTSKFWRHGPEWLKLPMSEWPVKDVGQTYTEESVLEMRAEDRKRVDTANVLLVADVGSVIEFARFGSWSKVRRVVAYVKRFINYLRNSELKRNRVLSAEELMEAEVLVIKSMQEGMKSLKEFSQIEKQLNVFSDDKGILRCAGRLSHSSMSMDRKSPILLPRRHHVTSQIVWDAHERVYHGGVNDTMLLVRNKYWIPQLRQLTRHLLFKCVICRWIDGKSYSSRPYPSLPTFRVNVGHPFSSAGTDFAGPLYVKTMEVNRHDTKVYIFLFTCMWSRAVHLEVVPDLGSSACIRGLRRFFARRGVPDLIMSDNAKVFKSEETRNFLCERGVVWRFSTPLAPWTGGVWERMIRSVKRCMKKVLKKVRLNYEELETVVVEIETTVNNRPLTYIDTDGIEDVLTPNHLSYGRSLPIIASGNAEISNKPIVNGKNVRKRFLHRQKLARDFCVRWEKEYLDVLRQSQKMPKTNKLRLPNIDDVVLVHGDSPRLTWRLARVVELCKSEDGECRSARVRLATTGNIVKRSVQCLYPLELSENERNETVEEFSVIDKGKPSTQGENKTNLGGVLGNGVQPRSIPSIVNGDGGLSVKSDNTCDQSRPIQAATRDNRDVNMDSRSVDQEDELSAISDDGGRSRPTRAAADIRGVNVYNQSVDRGDELVSVDDMPGRSRPRRAAAIDCDFKRRYLQQK